MTITRLQVKRLYKELLKYGYSLKLTDKNYYKSRIKQEFLDNKELVKPDEIQFFYDVSSLIINLVRRQIYQKYIRSNT